MALSAGSRLGPYEILAPLGAGGMGEVYRGRDTKLGRDVALKVLLDFFAKDPERLARFAREAKVLAALNHSNIAAICGLEDGGDVRALVMELVARPTIGRLAFRPPASCGSCRSSGIESPFRFSSDRSEQRLAGFRPTVDGSPIPRTNRADPRCTSRPFPVPAESGASRPLEGPVPPGGATAGRCTTWRRMAS